ncbi:MAG TPA: protein-L-isoaspartate(D-aspartate) O-methyltransferase [Gemmatimonadales bacterium]|nr:protein-L-isoaspartate(D-aspartate) O-methyltransferase [Gemmatimonadales bacterium]
MSRPAPGTAGLRRRMVREQIARRGIRVPRLLLAMDRTPREWFVPDESSADAYADEPLPLVAGQTISQPYVVALMTALLAPTRHDRVLEIGTGSGYQTAILARLVAEVYTVERLPELLVTAEARLRRMGLDNVQTLIADGARGWSAAAPFDGILVGAAAPSAPEPLLEQLAPGGRLVIPIGDRLAQELTVFTRMDQGLTTRAAGGVRFVPLVSPLSFDPGAAA